MRYYFLTEPKLHTWFNLELSFVIGFKDQNDSRSHFKPTCHVCFVEDLGYFAVVAGNIEVVSFEVFIEWA